MTATYLVIGTKHANRRGLDYTSAFLDSWQDAFSKCKFVLTLLGDEAQVTIIKDAFTDNALMSTYTKADFEEATV